MKTRVLRRGSVKGAYSPSSNHPFYGWHRFSGRYLCEDFAPRDEAIRPSGGRGANRPWPRAVISEFCGPRFAQGNRKQRLCGEASANRAGRRAGCPVSMGRPLFHQQAIGYSIPLSAAPASRVPVLTASNKLYCTTIYTA